MDPIDLVIDFFSGATMRVTNVFTTIELIAMKFSTDIYVSVSINSLTFYLVPSSDQIPAIDLTFTSAPDVLG